MGNGCANELKHGGRDERLARDCLVEEWTTKGGSKNRCGIYQHLPDIGYIYADLAGSTSGSDLRAILRQIRCDCGDNGCVIERKLYLLKIFVSGEKLFLGKMQFSHVEKTCRMGTEAGEYGFYIEQVLD